MTHLYLIRHGQALSSVENTFKDTGLSPRGVVQVERLRDRLIATGEITADVLIVSTMLRARQTAEILSPAFNLSMIFDDNIQEWRRGEAEALETVSAEEYLAQFETVALDQKPFFQAMLGAETWSQFLLRGATALNHIIHEYAGKTIVLICHGGIVECSLISFLGLSSFHYPKVYFNTHYASITHWWHTQHSKDVAPDWVLERFNDTMHLYDIDAPVSVPWRALVPIALST